MFDIFRIVDDKDLAASGRNGPAPDTLLRGRTSLQLRRGLRRSGGGRCARRGAPFHRCKRRTFARRGPKRSCEQFLFAGDFVDEHCRGSARRVDDHCRGWFRSRRLRFGWRRSQSERSTKGIGPAGVRYEIPVLHQREVPTADSDDALDGRGVDREHMSSRKDFQNANRCKGQRQGEGEGSTAGWYLRKRRPARVAFQHCISRCRDLCAPERLVTVAEVETPGSKTRRRRSASVCLF